MSIRLRSVDGIRVALCAAESDEMPGDVYLDDSDHYALAAKFALDWHGEVNTTEYPEVWAAMKTQNVRDAKDQLNKWLATQSREGLADRSVPYSPPPSATQQEAHSQELGVSPVCGVSTQPAKEPRL